MQDIVRDSGDAEMRGLRTCPWRGGSSPTNSMQDRVHITVVECRGAAGGNVGLREASQTRRTLTEAEEGEDQGQGKAGVPSMPLSTPV